MSKEVCPYCNKPATFSTSLQFYGKNYGTNVYHCDDCDARVGTHGKGKRALGTLANKELRDLRMTCHRLIDPYWRTKKMSRRRVYERLAAFMEISAQEAHIAMFNEDQCRKVIAKFERNE